MSISRAEMHLWMEAIRYVIKTTKKNEEKFDFLIAWHSDLHDHADGYLRVARQLKRMKKHPIWEKSFNDS